MLFSYCFMPNCWISLLADAYCLGQTTAIPPRLIGTTSQQWARLQKNIKPLAAGLIFSQLCYDHVRHTSPEEQTRTSYASCSRTHFLWTINSFIPVGLLWWHSTSLPQPHLFFLPLRNFGLFHVLAEQVLVHDPFSNRFKGCLEFTAIKYPPFLPGCLEHINVYVADIEWRIYSWMSWIWVYVSGFGFV